MSFLNSWFGPLYDAIFCPSLPPTFRWRLLAFQPIVLLSNAIQYLPSIFTKGRRNVIWIPLKRAPDHSVRAIVYHPRTQTHSGSRAIHLNIHGGGFLGGLPEGQTSFCQKVAHETGAIVVSTSHRYAPRYTPSNRARRRPGRCGVVDRERRAALGHESEIDDREWILCRRESRIGRCAGAGAYGV